MNWIRVHEKSLTQAGIIVLLLGYGVGIGVLLALKKPLYGGVFAGLPFIIAVLFWLQNHLDLAPAAILLTAAFVPLSLPTGTGSRIVASLILTVSMLGFWLLRLMVIEHRLSLRPSLVNTPLIGFIVTTLVSLVWSILFRDPNVFVPKRFFLVQSASALVMVALPAVLLFMVSRVDSLRPLIVLVVIVLAAGGLGLIKVFTSLPLPVNSNGLFASWVIAFSTSLAVFQRKLPWIRRILLLGLSAGWMYWGFGLHFDWLAGWLPGIIVLFVISLIRSKRLFLALILIMVVYGAVNFGSLSDRLGTEQRVSGDTRFDAWMMNWRVTSQHLLLGTGPAGYAVYYMSYFPSQAMATHNNYIDVISQTGILGFGFYLWIFGSLVWVGLKVVRRTRGRGDYSESLAVAAFAGTISCVVLMGFGDWLLPFAYTQTIAGFDYAVYNWIFMGFILVLNHISPEKAHPQPL